MGEVVALRENDTPQQVLDHAASADLKHVIVIGIDAKGDNYFQFNGNGSLKDLVWMMFSGENALHRILGDGAKGKI